MNSEIFLYAGVLLFGVFISAVSQVILKKSAGKKYDKWYQEYLNPLVILAYGIFFGATFCTIYAYKVLPISMGPILEATSYLYVTFFGVTIFHEKISLKKVVALGLIIMGIAVYSLLG